jgi:hypothetical protein
MTTKTRFSATLASLGVAPVPARTLDPPFAPWGAGLESRHALPADRALSRTRLVEVLLDQHLELG